MSSSRRYDLIPAHDLRITKVYVNRGYESTNPYYGYQEVKDLSGLPPLLGLERGLQTSLNANLRRVHP